MVVSVYSKNPCKGRTSWQVDEMMASSLALHLPHAPLGSQGLATAAIAPAPAATVYVPPAVCLISPAFCTVCAPVFSCKVCAFYVKLMGCCTAKGMGVQALGSVVMPPTQSAAVLPPAVLPHAALPTQACFSVQPAGIMPLLSPDLHVYMLLLDP